MQKIDDNGILVENINAKLPEDLSKMFIMCGVKSYNPLHIDEVAKSAYPMGIRRVTANKVNKDKKELFMTAQNFFVWDNTNIVMVLDQVLQDKGIKATWTTPSDRLFWEDYYNIKVHNPFGQTITLDYHKAVDNK